MELWTFEHFITIIPTIIIFAIITFILNRLLRNKSYKIRMIPFQVVACILLLSEVLKQVISIFNGYNLYHIPLHVCSLFVFLIPLMAFYRGKGENIIRTLTCTVCISLTLFMIVYPNLIYSKEDILGFFENYFAFHTVFFHNGVLFAFMLIIGLNLHSYDKKKYDKYVLIYSAGYSLLVAIMSQLLKINFSNFYTCNVGPINDLVNNIKNSIGYVGGQTLYVVILILLHIAFFYGSYKLYILFDLIVKKMTNKSKKQIN